MDHRKEYEAWRTDPGFDEHTRAELKALEGDEAEFLDRFYRRLEFGTGGPSGCDRGGQ